MEGSLRSYDANVRGLYKEHLQEVLALRTTMVEKIMPDIVDELSLDAEEEERARAWLTDLRMSSRSVFSPVN